VGERRGTPRLQLARLVADVAARQDGVAALDAGPRERRSTVSGDERVPGVVVIADDPAGRYAVSVYLRARFVDLRALADDVRAAVRAAAVQHGLEPVLGDVRIAVTDIEEGVSAP
jgi:hypothetical protein